MLSGLKQKSEESGERKSEKERLNGKGIDGERERDMESEEKWGKNSYIFVLIYLSSSFPQTPLHLAANENSVECVNTLIKHGADLETRAVRSKRGCEKEMCGDLCGSLMGVCLDVGV